MKNIVSYALAFVFIFAFIQHIKTQDIELEMSDESIKIDSIVNEKLKEFNVPGCVISIVKNGQIVHLNGYGYADIEAQKLVDPQLSKFRVASITKTFTALAILDFVDQGKLDLHANIRAYLSEKEFEWNEQYPITIHHILSHSAGFEYTDFRVHKKATKDQSLKVFAQTSIPNQVYKPGTVFSYSNQAYSILGYLIEQLSGMKYEGYMNKFVQEKLDMQQSSFFQHTKEHQLSNLVKPYQWDGQQFIEQERQFLLNPSASTLNSTGLDMAKFMLMMLQEGRSGSQQVIQQETFHKMLSPQFQPPVRDEHMGYGIFMEKRSGKTAYNHGGGVKGFLSFYELMPEENMGIFLSYNTRYGSEYFLPVVKNAIWDIFVAPNFPDQQPILNIDSIDQLAYKYEGRYQHYNVTQSSFEKAQRIFGLDEKKVTYEGNGVFHINGEPYKPISKNTFQYDQENRNRQVGFELGKDGKAEYFVPRLFFTYKRIPWYQSVLALQLGVGIGFGILLIFVFFRPIVQKIRTYKTGNHKTGKIEHKWETIIDRWLWWTGASFIFGFGILLSQYFLDVSIQNGATIGFKIGLLLTALGGILSIFSPLALWKIWTITNRPKRESIIQTIFIVGIVLIGLCFWELNLTGMKYY